MNEIPKHEQDEPINEPGKEQPQAEMPEDFEDPEGRSGKWKTVKGEVEVEGKKVEVSYREKVIDLPKHRQVETGITRIRRRELLPPFPEGLYKEDKKGDFYAGGDVKFNDCYRFLTNERYPSDKVIVHRFQLYGQDDIKARNIKRFKEQGLYFQEIFPQEYDERFQVVGLYDDKRKKIIMPKLKQGEEIPNDKAGLFGLYCSQMEMEYHSDYNTPVFIFGNKNEEFNTYIDSINKNVELMEVLPDWKREFERTQIIRNGLPVNSKLDKHIVGGEWLFPCVRFPGIKPMRWCHAECALVPTKRGLNVLFFETGDPPSHKATEGQSENKKEDEMKSN